MTSSEIRKEMIKIVERYGEKVDPHGFEGYHDYALKTVTEIIILLSKNEKSGDGTWVLQ